MAEVPQMNLKLRNTNKRSLDTELASMIQKEVIGYTK